VAQGSQAKRSTCLIRIVAMRYVTENPRVGGSIPPPATIPFSRLREFCAVKFRRYGPLCP
jgi:hypothetical protein